MCTCKALVSAVWSFTADCAPPLPCNSFALQQLQWHLSTEMPQQARPVSQTYRNRLHWLVLLHCSDITQWPEPSLGQASESSSTEPVVFTSHESVYTAFSCLVQTQEMWVRLQVGLRGLWHSARLKAQANSCRIVPHAAEWAIVPYMALVCKPVNALR